LSDEEASPVGRVHRLPATPRTVHTGFYDNSLEPVLAVDSGDVVSLETMMLLDGRLKPGLSLEEIMAIRSGYRSQGLSSHTLTGPIYINGAEPGNTLEVRILRLVPYPFGVNFSLPGATGAGTLPEEFPLGYVHDFEWEDGSTEISFGRGINLRLRPFLGSMAVAPATPGRVSAVPPGPYGGNLDLKELVEGTTLYLPIFVPGALFSAGDAHALQGDGEVNTSAVETALREARLQFVVRRDMALTNPLAETPAHWIAMGFDPDLDEAARIALREALGWLVRCRGLSREEAYSLCSLAVDFRVTQLVDRNKGVHAMIPKAIFQ
jgi:acetamidase/formamidase